MKKLLHKLSEIWGMVIGLSITGKYLLSRDVTVYYPRQTVAPKDALSFRGHIELVGLDDNPETPRCVSCLLCVQACPSGCITVTKSKAPAPTEEQLAAMEEAKARGEKPKAPAAPKYPAQWLYDHTLCSLCGMCVEACPADSIRFSHNIYLAGTSADDFRLNLLARLKRRAGEEAGRTA
jgi:NADH-quinone oxidoreductase subunit I